MSDPPQSRDARRSTGPHGHDVLDPLYVGIVSVSSSRGPGDDAGGDQAEQAVDGAGHRVTARTYAADDVADIRSTVLDLVAREDVDCIVTTGGTGVTIDDVTPLACQGLFERRIPGFGERFRAISWEEIGHRAMSSRATAGVIAGTPTFCVPGSPGAVETAMEQLILPEAPHLAGLATRHEIEG